jgi:hypothetical protein
MNFHRTIRAPARGSLVVDESNKALRHYCRNPKCRMKLPAPVSIERNAFCCRGCYAAFFRHRCLICEEQMERKTEHQLICGKRKCRNALEAGIGRDRSYVPSAGSAPQKTPDFIDSETAPKPDRGWRIVAGPMSPDQIAPAIVPDGPGGRWEGGTFLRIEAKNRAALAAAGISSPEVEANSYFADTEWREVTSPDGVACLVAQTRRPRR